MTIVIYFLFRGSDRYYDQKESQGIDDINNNDHFDDRNSF